MTTEFIIMALMQGNGPIAQLIQQEVEAFRKDIARLNAQASLTGLATMRHQGPVMSKSTAAEARMIAKQYRSLTGKKVCIYRVADRLAKVK